MLVSLVRGVDRALQCDDLHDATESLGDREVRSDLDRCRVRVVDDEHVVNAIDACLNEASQTPVVSVLKLRWIELVDAVVALEELVRAEHGG